MMFIINLPQSIVHLQYVYSLSSLTKLGPNDSVKALLHSQPWKSKKKTMKQKVQKVVFLNTVLG